MKITVAGVNKEVADNLTVAQLVIDERQKLQNMLQLQSMMSLSRAVHLKAQNLKTAMLQSSFTSWEVVSNGFYK